MPVPVHLKGPLLVTIGVVRTRKGAAPMVTGGGPAPMLRT